MADVKKCDVCHRTYPGVKDTFGDLVSSYVRIVDREADGTLPERITYDTCPVCMNRIRNYLNNLVLEAENIGVLDVSCISACSKKRSLLARLFRKCSNCP